MSDQLRQVADERAAASFRDLFLTLWPKVRAMLLRQGPAPMTAEETAPCEPGRQPECHEAVVPPGEGADSGMHSAVEALSADELHILRLCFVDGLSPEEIAAKLALPLGTVNFRTRQAFHKLRCAIESRS